MSFSDFMNKVRHWDNMIARWFLRHFYFMFFQIVLVVIFVFWFVNLFNVIDTSVQASMDAPNAERILKAQSINMSIIVFLMLLNSFWMLYVFNGIQRLSHTLKDISFGIERLRSRPPKDRHSP